MLGIEFSGSLFLLYAQPQGNPLVAVVLMNNSLLLMNQQVNSGAFMPHMSADVITNEGE